jgi:hypothetical protein
VHTVLYLPQKTAVAVAFAKLAKSGNGVLKLNGEQLKAGAGDTHQRLQSSWKPEAASV